MLLSGKKRITLPFELVLAGFKIRVMVLRDLLRREVVAISILDHDLIFQGLTM